MPISNVDPFRGTGIWGNSRMRIATYTGPNPYTTGGESLDGKVPSLGTIEQVYGGLRGGTGLIVAYWDKATKKLQLFWGDNANAGAAALIEVTNATNLSGYTG